MALSGAIVGGRAGNVRSVERPEANETIVQRRVLGCLLRHSSVPLVTRRKQEKTNNQ